VRKLTALIERDDAEVIASNQVVGEACIAVQHHYVVSKPDRTHRTCQRAQERSGGAAERAGVFATRLAIALGRRMLVGRWQNACALLFGPIYSASA
jgi:hypothetical protein